MMRVGLDGRCLNTPHLRGMGKVVFELLRHNTSRPDLSFVIFGDEPTAPVHHPDSRAISSRVWEVKGHRFRAWEQWGLPREAARMACNLLHCPGTWCPYWQPIPTVVTVHDTLPWLEDQDPVFVDRLLPSAYRRARAIITGSDSAKRDILDRWPDLASKLTVIRWGIRPEYFAPAFSPVPEELRAAGVRRPYLLYFGGEIPRKRLAWAVKVWESLDRDDVNLVVCGLQRPSGADPRAHVRPELRSRFICLDFIPEESLPSLYAEAAAVLYPTTYEGFGFPAVESQAVGTPVLMSAVGSLTELAGPGAVLLPPDDLHAWTEVCHRMLAGDRRVDSSRSRAWAKQFSWAEAAAKTACVYERVLNGKGVA